MALTHFPSLRLGLPAPQQSRRKYAQSLLGPSFHDPRMHHVFESHSERASPLPRRTTCCRLSRRPCTVPLFCSLQPLLKLSLLNLEPLCERCLLITESLKNPGHYRYLIWVLVYIPCTGLAVFSLGFLVFLCILRFRIFKVRVLNASE